MIAWAGAKMPLSSELADSVLEVLADAAQGDFFDPEMEAARPMLETQMLLSRIPTPEDAADRAARVARGPASVPLSVRRPQRPRSASAACSRVAAIEGSSRTPFRSSSTTTASSLPLSAKPVDPDAARRPEPVRRRRPAPRRARQPELERARAPALSRDRARLRPHQPGLPGPAEVDAPAAGVELALLRSLSQVRQRQQTSQSSRERGAEPGARHEEAEGGTEAHAPAARRLLQKLAGAEPVFALVLLMV